MTPAMVVRGEAAQACIDRFAGKPLKWGTVDCGKLVAHNMRQLGIGTGFLKGLSYSTEIGAAKAVRSLGCKGMADAMDLFESPFRIPPAMATQGDVVGMACEGELWDMALCVVVGNGRMLGIVDGVCAVFQPDMTHALAAWRCNPCRR